MRIIRATGQTSISLDYPRPAWSDARNAVGILTNQPLSLASTVFSVLGIRSCEPLREARTNEATSIVRGVVVDRSGQLGGKA